MSTVISRINQRLTSLNEDAAQQMGDYKNPHNANYDRQWSEDALYHTIGPLTDNPRWINGSWSSPSQPVPGFTPGGTAPRWTPEEVIYAMAGDPSLAFKSGARDNPKAPQYGNKGGSPLWRLARRVSRIYKRDTDNQFIADMYSNGFVPLVRMMQPGFDEGRSPFISYTMRTIQGAMEHGVGGTEQGIRARGGESTSGVSGLDSLLKAKTPEDARKIANQIKGVFTTGKHHDKHADNPFGPFSHRVHSISMQYADALASGDFDLINRTKEQIQTLIDEIDEDQKSFIPGASTGMGQAISTPDRKTSIKVGSMDVSADEEKGSMAGNIPSYEEEESSVDHETIVHALDIAMAHDLTRWLAKDPELMGFATKMGFDPSDKLGKITANELRYLIRSLGRLGAQYPGKGTPRKSLNIARDAKDWWKPLEDPEIEPIPGSGGLWKSIWSRTGTPEMGPTEITRELTEEVREFQKLGIKTASVIKQKEKGLAEVKSKVAVSNTLTSALLKLKIIIYSQRESMGLDESTKKELRTEGYPILEDYDPTDRRIIIETLDWMIRKVTRKLVEDAPPGFSHVVERLKDSKSDDEAFAIAWSAYKKGDKPDPQKQKKGDKYISPSERK